MDQAAIECTEKARAALRDVLLSLSPDGATLPVDEATFVPTLIGIVRGMAVLAAARNATGERIDPAWLGRELGKEFAFHVRPLEARYSSFTGYKVVN